MTLLEYIKEFFSKIGSLLYIKVLQPVLSKIAKLISYIDTHRQFSIWVIVFIVYLVLSYVFMFSYDYFGYNEYSYITNIIFIIAGVGFLFSLLNKYYSPKEGMTPTILNVFKRLFLILAGIVLVFGLIYIISYGIYFYSFIGHYFCHYGM